MDHKIEQETPISPMEGGKKNHEEQCKESHQTRLPRSVLPPLTIPGRQRRGTGERAILSRLVWLQAQSLPGRSPGRLVLEQSLSLLLVGITQLLIGLFALVRLGVLLFLLVDLPLLGL